MTQILLFFILFSTGLLLATFGAIVWITRVWERIAIKMREEIASRVAKPVRVLKNSARMTSEIIWGRGFLLKGHPRAIPGR